MNIHSCLKAIFTFTVIVFSISLQAQTPIDINSGDPAFPFPQFSSYRYNNQVLDNLANQNADGLTHAEMEKRIREAWLIMSNRFQYDGDSHAGVQYIQSNLGCPYDCSEGVGYGMIAAAYLADKTTFDGIWFREHDVRLVAHPRYRDGVIPRPGYQFGENTLAEPPGGDSATDGDVDIALGLLMAWKQWGDDSGYIDFNGNSISYKEEALRVIRGLVEVTDRGLGDCRRVSGVIGFDGYFKNGNTWGELTDWTTGQDPCPEFAGPQQTHVDYIAPAYCKAFADFLEAEGDVDDLTWNVPQLRRAEASSDWLMGELYNQGPNTLPVAGNVDIDANNNARFTNFNEGEDFRYAWRTILNHTWYGNPTVSWNPETHQIINGGNTNNFDMAERFSDFLLDPSITGNGCVNPGGGLGLTFNGPSQVVQNYNPNTGLATGAFPINWLVATATPSAVSAQNFDLMGKLYRQCAIEWDQTSGQNLDSSPFYFHGFFRLLGMLVVTGNFQSPIAQTPEANIKIYSEVDKTFAFTGDEVTFTLSYRNYGSVAAQNVIITDQLPAGLTFVSATDGGVNNGDRVTWNQGTVAGVTTAGGISPTIGQVSITCRVAEGFSGRICNPTSISTTSGEGWVSNEFPNNITSVMERNCVDVIERTLEIEKTVDIDIVMPGDIVTYEVNFSNSSEGEYINGGRSGINFAYARDTNDPNSSTQRIKMRLYHGADEPYINYENYRLSLFLNDDTYNCIAGTAGCNVGWRFRDIIYEGGDANNVEIFQEPIVPGVDANGAWNQRVVVQFADQKAGPTPHLLRYFGTPRVHEGGDQPLRAVWDLFTSNFLNVDWSDDWSWNQNASDADGGLYYPITNDWTDYDNPDLPVNRYHNEACETPNQTVDNILIEEWDGYTWRRIFGSGPVPGRDIENVILTDVLPIGFTFVEFVGPNPLGIAPTTSLLPSGQTEIKWEIPEFQIGQSGTLTYRAEANFSSGNCPRSSEVQTNIASISAENESPISSSVAVTVICNTCDSLPDTPVVRDIYLCLDTEIVNIEDFVTATATLKWYSDAQGTQVISTPIIDTTVGSENTYYVSQIDANGCESALAEIAVNIVSLLIPEVNDINLCLGSETVNIENFVTATTTLQWYSDAQGTQAITTPIINTNVASETTYYVSQIDNNSCESALAEITVSIGVLPTPEVNDINLCLSSETENIEDSVTSTATLQWYSDDQGTQIIPTPIINTNVTSETTYYVRQIDNNSCESALAEITVTIGSLPTPEVNDINLCLGSETENIEDFVTATATLQWYSDAQGTQAITTPIINTNVTSETTYYVSQIDNNSCESALAEITVNIGLLPTPEVNDINLCLGSETENIEDFVTATATLQWYSDAQGTQVISTPIINTNIASETTYYLSQIDNNSCESALATITVTILEIAIIATNTITIESGDRVNYNVINGFNLTTEFSWNAINNAIVTGETLNISQTDEILDVLVNTTTVSQVVIYEITSQASVNGCDEISILEVIVDPIGDNQQIVSITDDAVEEGEIFNFIISLNSPAVTETIFTIGFSEITAQAPEDMSFDSEQVIIQQGETSTNLTRLTNEDSIDEPTETLSVFIENVIAGNINFDNANAIGTIYNKESENSSRPLFPLYFTPNSDGINDTWEADTDVNNQIKTIHIYDRYGKILTELTQNSPSWNGIYGGNLMPVNDYWYYATLIDGTIYKGHFTLKY